MFKNYYVILGIRSDATQDEIKSAYRTQAKKRHPDCSGEGSEAFLLIRDAYEVLSDPRRRRAHDQELARHNAQRDAVHCRAPAPRRAARPPVEPLTPSPRTGYARDTYRDPPISSVFEELFGGRWDDAAFQVEPGRAVDEIHAEVSLTQRQARYGGRVRISLPIRAACPACRGRGWDGFVECPYCRGSGTLVDRRAVDVVFPGGVYDGFTGSLRFRLPGRHELSLVLHFRVDPW